MDSKERATGNKKLDNKKTEMTICNKSKNVNDNLTRSAKAERQKKKTSWRYWNVSENSENNMPIVAPPSPKSSIKKNEAAADYSEDGGSTFQTPIAGDAITSIEIFKDDSTETVLLLESSDDDEVVEIALPPKPTIYVDSSDEEGPSTSKEKDALLDDSLPNEEIISTPEKDLKKIINYKSNERNPTCSSPVPSVVSSVSDDFIRGDCAALNISNRRQEKSFDFDFNLHGTDLMDESRNNSLISGGKKKKQKQKTNKNVGSVTEGDFAKPKNKSKTKKQSKYFDKDTCEPDVHKSDNSNQLLENISKTIEEDDKSGPTEPHPIAEEPTIASVDENISLNVSDAANDSWMTIDTTGEISEPSTDEPIVENIVMANVSGISSINSSSDAILHDVVLEIKESFFQPELLEPGYEFPNPQVMEKHVLEMKKFYDESWGGERFDHDRIIQKMPRDKSLWRIMPADRAPRRNFRGPTCNYCNQVGHRDDRCFRKPLKCYMCGHEGHSEPRCPNKICLICGSPNYLYSGGCNRCASWSRMSCNICHGRGHPATACPDTWRRYHRTLKNDGALIQFRKTKKNAELSCSGCTRQGHSVQTCNQFIKFSHLPVPTAHIQQYVPLYEPSSENRGSVSRNINSRAIKSSQSKNSTLVAPIKVVDAQKNNTNELEVRRNNSLTKTTQQINSIPKNTHQFTAMAGTPTSKKRCTSDNVLSNTSTPHASQVPNFSPDVCFLATPKSKLSLTPKSNSFSETGTITSTSVSSVETPPSKTLGKRKLELVETLSSDNKRSIRDGNTISSSNSFEEPQVDKFNNVQKKLNTQGKVGSPLVQDNNVSNSDDVIKYYNINITENEYNILNSHEGSEYIIAVKLKYKLKTFDISRPNSGRPLYVITFEGNDHPALEKQINDDVILWLDARSKQSIPNNKPDENEQSPAQTVGANALVECKLPKKRKILLEMLLKDMGELKNDLGDPRAIHKELLYLQKHHASLLKEKCISQQKITNSRRKINKHLKALNMILLGQAGLADGAKRLNALYSITDTLQTGSYDIVKEDLRCRVAQHYNVLFSGASRTDYPELVAKYYLHRNHRSVQKIGKKIAKNSSPRSINKKKQFNNEAVTRTKPLRLPQQKGNFNHEISKKVWFCTSQLRMMPVKSAPQNTCIRNYLGQLHYIWKHLNERSSSNREEVHGHAHHLTSEIMSFLEASAK